MRIAAVSVPVVGAAFLIMAYPVAASENPCVRFGMVHGLFAMKVDGTQLRLLRRLQQPTLIDKVRVSPDGKKLVFLECTKDLNHNCACDGAEYFHKRVVVSKFDGSQRRVISHGTGGFNDYPSWSPDGRDILFMRSSRSTPRQADLFRFNLASSRTTNVTRTKEWMESDSAWNGDQTISLVREPVELDPNAPRPNNLFTFDLRSSTVEQLTAFSKKSGKHCCVADPKRSPNGVLAFAQWTRADGEDDVWDIQLRFPDGRQRALTSSDATNSWPMWSPSDQHLLWVEWRDRSSTWSVKLWDSVTDRISTVTLIAPKLSFQVNDKNVLFGRIGWPCWMPSEDGEIVFPATYAIW